jgi:hypothetical protein
MAAKIERYPDLRMPKPLARDLSDERRSKAYE